MSYKMFSVAQAAPGKHGSADKSKETPPAEQPTTQPTRQPDQKPVQVAPAPKS